MENPIFDIYQSKGKSKDWGWRLLSEKEEIIASSHQLFPSKRKSQSETRKVMKAIQKLLPAPTPAPVPATPPEIPTPTPNVSEEKQIVVSLEELPWERLHRSWNEQGLQNITPVFLDEVYTVPKLEDIKRFIELSEIDRVPYMANKKDCDDFARMFAAEMSWKYNITAIALVIDTSSMHAYNAFWARDGDLLTFHIIEPQTDAIRYAGEELYKGANGYAII